MNQGALENDLNRFDFTTTGSDKSISGRDESHFKDLERYNIAFEADDLYTSIRKISDEEIIKDPLRIREELSSLIEAKKIFSQPSDPILKGIIRDPVGNYSLIYLVGTYLSACINSNFKDENFLQVIQMAEGVYSEFSRMTDDAIRSSNDIIPKLRQAIPILFLNLAKMYYDSGDVRQAREWYHRSHNSSCRLGTSQFAFLSMQEFFLLETHAHALVKIDNGPEVVNLVDMPDEQKISVKEYVGRLHGYAKGFYDKFRDHPKAQNMAMRNKNKYDIALLYSEGILLLQSLQSISGLKERSAHSVASIIEGEKAVTSSEIVSFFRKLRELKNRYIESYYDGSVSFLHSDMTVIAACEAIGLNIGLLLEASDILGLGKEYQKIISSQYWIPRNVSDREISMIGKDVVKNEGTVIELNTTILNVNRELDVRYVWMDIFNILYRAKRLIGNDSQILRVRESILRQIAFNIVGINPSGLAISKFLADPEHPVVIEFIENMAELGFSNSRVTTIEEEDNPRETGGYEITGVGGELDRIRLGETGFDDVIHYLDSYLGLNGWLIRYQDIPVLGNQELDRSHGKFHTQSISDTKGSKKRILISANNQTKLEIFYRAIKSHRSIHWLRTAVEKALPIYAKKAANRIDSDRHDALFALAEMAHIDLKKLPPDVANTIVRIRKSLNFITKPLD